MKGTIKFIDLFAGIGGIRCGLELAAHEAGYKTECVFTSEIKKHAIKVLKQNHPNELINGDITQVNEKETERVRNTTQNSSVGERRTARGCTNTPDECSRLQCKSVCGFTWISDTKYLTLIP